MRKIQFRGKNKYRKEWLYGSLSQYGDGSYGINGVPVEADTVGQFTGLCDKNGKEIFEGDIVRCQDSMGYSFVSPVEFREGKFCMKTKYSNCITFSNKGQYNDGKCSFEYDIEHEVIGNIHDNPELLK